jgi:hypothetical protein
MGAQPLCQFIAIKLWEADIEPTRIRYFGLGTLQCPIR